MKAKKILPFILATNYLFTFSIPAFANTFLQDERYEVLEGKNIVVENILEHSKSNVEIYGNSIVNFANYIDNNSFTLLHGTVDDNGYIEIVSNSDYRNFFLKKEVVNVKPDTKYTFIVDILENTLVKSNGKTDNCIFFGKSNPGNEPSYWEDFKCLDGGITGIYKFTLNTKKDFSNVTVGDRGFVDSNLSGKIKFRYMIIEGDYTDYDIEYFRGMKSVGQNNDGSLGIQISSAGKNLFNKNNVVNEFIEMDTGKLLPSESGLNRTTEWIDCKPNTTYTVSGGERNRWLLKSSDGRLTYIGSTSGNATPTITTLDDTIAFKCYVVYRDVSLLDSIQIEEGKISTEYTPYIEDISKIRLKEPLRGITNSTQDKIIKKNGQWFIERNYSEFVIDGDENIAKETSYTPTDTSLIRFNVYINGILSGKENILLSDRLPYVYIHETGTSSVSTNQECITNHSQNKNEVNIIIQKSRLNSPDVNGFREWLSENPITIIYEVENPLNEQITFKPLQLYLDTTYISSKSSVKPILKASIDRAANKAMDYTESIEINSTVENLELARMWVNLMKDSILKDQLQNKLNEMFGSDMELEKQTVSANLDLYIQWENMLMMTLSTNTITFENYSGIEDLELNNAINISINSSLPYQLNAYIVGDITNKNKDKTLDLDVLNIRDSSEIEYKQFDSVNSKLVLLENVDSGNNIIHNIDLKLSSDNAHDADIYKTTIKFEAEQK